jgi:hypothetical protein
MISIWNKLVTTHIRNVMLATTAHTIRIDIPLYDDELGKLISMKNDGSSLVLVFKRPPPAAADRKVYSDAVTPARTEFL